MFTPDGIKSDAGTISLLIYSKRGGGRYDSVRKFRKIEIGKRSQTIK
jgi:hypothetical protein